MQALVTFLFPPPMQVSSVRLLRDQHSVDGIRKRGVGFCRFVCLGARRTIRVWLIEYVYVNRLLTREMAEESIRQHSGRMLPGSRKPLQIRFADSRGQQQVKELARAHCSPPTNPYFVSPPLPSVPDLYLPSPLLRPMTPRQCWVQREASSHSPPGLSSQLPLPMEGYSFGAVRNVYDVPDLTPPSTPPTEHEDVKGGEGDHAGWDLKRRHSDAFQTVLFYATRRNKTVRSHSIAFLNVKQTGGGLKEEEEEVGGEMPLH
jgi:hypothetical protein